MSMNHNRAMPARLSAFVIWTLVAFAAAFWGLRLLVQAAPPPANAVAASELGSLRGDLSRLLGAEPVALSAALVPQAASRFKLLGVMAQKAVDGAGAAPGFALISVDGKPARAFAAGASIDEQWVLQSVSLRSASLGPANGAPAVVLEVPRLPPPATGTLPSPSSSDQATSTPAVLAPAARSVLPGRPREGMREQPPRRAADMPLSSMPAEAVR